MKTIQEMVQKATGATGTLLTCSLVNIKEIERFAALVREDERNRTWTQEHWTEYERSIAAVEREACAKVCEELVSNMSRTANEASVWDVATFDCAEAIRARKNKHD